MTKKGSKRTREGDIIEENSETHDFKAKRMDIRDFLAKLFTNYRELGGDSQTFIKALECENISISRSSLYDYCSILKSKGTNAVNYEKKGHQRLVTDEQLRVLIGSILIDNEKRVVCQYSDILKRCKKWFQVEPSYDTVRNYCAKNGICVKRLLHKSSPDSQIPQKEVYRAHIRSAYDLQAQQVFDDPSRVICVDFMHDSHWDEAQTGLGGKGNIIKFDTKKNRHNYKGGYRAPNADWSHFGRE